MCLQRTQQREQAIPANGTACSPALRSNQAPPPAEPPKRRFQPYAPMPGRLSLYLWRGTSFCGIAAALGIAAAGVVAPRLALTLFWDLFVPLAPLVFLVAPGLWRNVCPMAALNQIPRAVGFARGWKIPSRVQPFSPLISAG